MDLFFVLSEISLTFHAGAYKDSHTTINHYDLEDFALFKNGVKKICLLFLFTSLLFALTSCSAMHVSKGPEKNASEAPILIQGAMDLETGVLIKALENPKIEKFGSWTFWCGTYQGKPVVVSRTEVGLANAAASTTLAIEKYRPRFILNQGTSGGHDPALHAGDIVLGVKAVNTGAIRTERKEVGQGIDTGDWKPFNVVLRLRGAKDEKVEADALLGDPALLEAAYAAREKYEGGKVVKGVIGSADQLNRELDRIGQVRSVYNTSCEEMETVAAALVAKAYDIPFLGIRILSNSEFNQEDFDYKTAFACQNFVLSMVKEMQ